jgi:hypothetical protein
MPILLLAVRIACAVQFGLRVRTVDGRTLPELTRALLDDKLHYSTSK